jgi:uncharacterized protein (DUF302 family)
MRFLVALFAVLTASSLHAQDTAAKDTLKTQASKFTFDETVDRLSKAIEAKGIKIAAKFDHAAGAKAAGMELPPTVVLLFGNPKLGTPLMQADQRSGLDLPMKMLVWQDKAGKVHVGYAPPSALQDRYEVKGDGAANALKAMTGALDGFSKAATGSE